MLCVSNGCTCQQLDLHKLNHRKYGDGRGSLNTTESCDQVCDYGNYADSEALILLYLQYPA